jgi:hypothetical protein
VSGDGPEGKGFGPAGLAFPIHDRMPIILDPDGCELWLDPGITNVSAASDLLEPFDTRLMRCYPVSARTNRSENNDEGCSAPVEFDPSRIGYSHSTMTDDIQHGQPLSIDATARSASPTEPAFIARPDGAPVYYGFVVLDDVTAEGFTLGKITDWEAEPCEAGDAFVIAPDGGRAGLVWEASDKPYFQEVMPGEASRWGVWGVGFRLPMNSRENARAEETPSGHRG